MVSARQVKKKVRARIGSKADASAVPVEIGEGHRIDDPILRPPAAKMHSDGPPHHLTSVEEIALGQRQHRGRLAGQMHAVGAYLVGLWIDLNMRRRRVMDHASFVD